MLILCSVVRLLCHPERSEAESSPFAILWVWHFLLTMAYSYGTDSVTLRSILKDVIVEFLIPFELRRPDYETRCTIEGWDSARSHRYMNALMREVQANAPEFTDCRVQAIHWGGGVATMVNAQDLARVMRFVRDHYTVAEGSPVTLRGSISGISGASMPFYRRAGITRFDLEMMSLYPVGYERVNNQDSLGDFPVICDYFLHSAAQNNTGVVLLYGYEKAEPRNLRRSVVELTRSKVVHLILQRAQGPFAVDDATAKEQLAEIRPLLEEAGFVEYVPDRWAKSGCEDKFAQLKAAGNETIGFGLGATTLLDGVSTTTTDDLDLYCENSYNFAAITKSVIPV